MFYLNKSFQVPLDTSGSKSNALKRVLQDNDEGLLTRSKRKAKIQKISEEDYDFNEYFNK